MAETKPFASLSSGLLARKGGAKPAMRPQGFGGFGGNHSAPLDDLGWNDMGGATPYHEHVSTPIDGLTPVGRAPAAEPVVLEQQREIETRLAPQAAPQPAEPSEAPAKATAPAVVRLPRSRAADSKGKAAFTLRLDPERHLKLRLACALTRRSAQQLVTEALDDFLHSLPEIDALADRVPAQAGRRGR